MSQTPTAIPATNKLAAAAITLGIATACLTITGGIVLAWLLAPLAFILGLIAGHKSTMLNGAGKAWAMWGTLLAFSPLIATIITNTLNT